LHIGRAARAVFLVLFGWAALAGSAMAAGKGDEIRRGRYLIETAGCNDCHTPGYGANNGKVDEKLWGWCAFPSSTIRARNDSRITRGRLWTRSAIHRSAWLQGASGEKGRLQALL
jgi:hypothetical protein